MSEVWLMAAEAGLDAALLGRGLCLDHPQMWTQNDWSELCIRLSLAVHDAADRREVRRILEGACERGRSAAETVLPLFTAAANACSEALGRPLIEDEEEALPDPLADAPTFTDPRNRTAGKLIVARVPVAGPRRRHEGG